MKIYLQVIHDSGVNQVINVSGRLYAVAFEEGWTPHSHMLGLRIITGSYVTTTRKPQFIEEDPWSRVESSKFRPMFAGVNVSFHLYVLYGFGIHTGYFHLKLLRCWQTCLSVSRHWGHEKNRSKWKHMEYGTSISRAFIPLAHLFRAMTTEEIEVLEHMYIVIALWLLNYGTGTHINSQTKNWDHIK